MKKTLFLTTKTYSYHDTEDKGIIIEFWLLYTGSAETKAERKYAWGSEYVR
jgi:hypothetical protein